MSIFRPKDRLGARQEKWVAEESIHAAVSLPDTVKDEPENARIADLAFRQSGSIRVRVSWGVYGPGTEKNPRPRYWWCLGENATIVCRDPKVYGWLRERLKEFFRDMDGVVLEEDNAA